MDDTKNCSKCIRYEYEEDPGAKLKVAHGVWGGVSTQGEIELNFYAESDKLPHIAERLLTPEGIIGPESIPQNEDPRIIIRHVHSKILLNYNTARALATWLEEKIESIEMNETGSFFYDDKGIEQ